MSGVSTQHILDAIDGALLDYTVSGDAMRWTPEPVDVRPTGLRLPAGYVYTAPTSEQVSVAMRAFGESFQRSMAELGEALTRMGEAFKRAKPLLEDADLIPTTPPDDLKARALWLRQNRNTGPSRDVVHMRRPRRHVTI